LTNLNYAQLQALYEKYKDKGLEILGFPCNQFGSQEPGSNQDIIEFVKTFNVSFEMMDKIDVNGSGAHPLFVYLKTHTDSTFGSFIKWNFTKFLVDSKGIPFKRYGPPEAPFTIESDIRQLLGLPADDKDTLAAAAAAAKA